MTGFIPSFTAFISPAFAAGTVGQPWDQCAPNGVATLECIPIVFQNAVSAMIVFAGVISLVLVILSGYKYIMSKGDQKQVEEAKKSLSWTLFGLAVVVFSFLIINIISYITGVDCIRFFGFGNCQ
ncbi:hypothetical protein KKG52_00850 [Patescibacteria group bacterium]|nr:hypothetical protein [Patescibacteria group bacterium]